HDATLDLAVRIAGDGHVDHERRLIRHDPRLPDDLYAERRHSVLERRAVGTELPALRLHQPARRATRLAQADPVAIQQFDRRRPDAAHLAWLVPADIGECASER